MTFITPSMQGKAASRAVLRAATALCLTAAVLGSTLVPAHASETTAPQEKASREETLQGRSGQTDKEETPALPVTPSADPKTPAETPPAEEVPAESTSDKETPAEETPAEEVPVEPAPDEAAWSLRLINWQNPLEESFAPPALTDMGSGHKVDSRIAASLQAMLADARKAGLHPLLCSSFRTNSKQTQLFQRKVRYYQSLGYGRTSAEEKASFWVARPGTSEHEAGLAVDIISTEYQILNQKQENTAVQKWLMAHCAEYGFVLRYPSDKSAVTHVGYEPWHYRYVGETAAREMTDRGLCLEEYLAEKAARPA